MKNSELKTSLIQSAVVLGCVIILFIIIASSGSEGGGVLSFFSTIGNTILLVLGLTIGLILSIVCLLAIFFGAVAMINPSQASYMFHDLKKNCSKNVLTYKGCCCETEQEPSENISKEHEQMKQQITELENQNQDLQDKVDSVKDDNKLLEADLTSLTLENKELTTKVSDLSDSVTLLQTSEESIKTQIEELTTKIKEADNSDLQNQLKSLEKIHQSTKQQIQDIAQRIDKLETDIVAKDKVEQEEISLPSTGIFSYIESNEDRLLYAAKVKEAVLQEQTYAQIDTFLTENLPPELDTIIKDHPSLSKDFIRETRKG